MKFDLYDIFWVNKAFLLILCDLERFFFTYFFLKNLNTMSIIQEFNQIKLIMRISLLLKIRHRVLLTLDFWKKDPPPIFYVNFYKKPLNKKYFLTKSAVSSISQSILIFFFFYSLLSTFILVESHLIISFANKLIAFSSPKLWWSNSLLR